MFYGVSFDTNNKVFVLLVLNIAIALYKVFCLFLSQFVDFIYLLLIMLLANIVPSILYYWNLLCIYCLNILLNKHGKQRSIKYLVTQSFYFRLIENSSPKINCLFNKFWPEILQFKQL